MAPSDLERNTEQERFPAPVYTETVLADNFRDAQRYFLAALLDIHYAHTVMLTEQGILSREEGCTLVGALDCLDRNALATARYTGESEDFFFHVERELTRLCDRETAGKLHTARSRNDIDLTLYRMQLRGEVLLVLEGILDATAALLTVARAHVTTVMPAYTHTQPAQPTTLAHYLLGAIECLERDAIRLQAAYATVNRNPLGACAITTTGFPINRARTAFLLGFEGLQTNSYGAIAAVDYVTEAAAAVAVAMVNLGKVVQDMLLWCTPEFGFLHLSDGFVQTSSIMPQKRNPVALEHTRILASRALGQAQALLTATHNTPFGDIVDSEDDLQPLVFTLFADARRALRLFAAAMSRARIDREHLRRRATANFLTVTELADTLAREDGLSFHDAHRLVAAAVNEDRDSDSHERIVDCIQRLAPSVLQRPVTLSRQRMLAVLDPEHFVRVRNIPGGPAPEAVHQELERAAAQWEQAGTWLSGKREGLRSRERHLRSAADQLLGAGACPKSK